MRCGQDYGYFLVICGQMNKFVLFTIAFRRWVVKKLLQQEEITSEILTTLRRSVAAKAPVTDEDMMDFTQIRTDAELVGFEKLKSDVQRKQMVCQ